MNGQDQSQGRIPGTSGDGPRSLRGTGRTTRMLQEAIRLAREGRYVFVVADSLDSARQFIIPKIVEIHPAARVVGGLKVYIDPGQISVCLQSDRQFDWETLRFRGAHPSCVVLIDHHAIEARFASILGELHRWDSGADQGSSGDEAPPSLLKGPWPPQTSTDSGSTSKT